MNLEGFVQVLPYLGKGMLGIFAVTAVLIVCIYLLNRLAPGKKD